MFLIPVPSCSPPVSYTHLYSAELSEKVVRGMTENVLKGKYNGGTIPIGFKAVSYTHLRGM